MKVSNLEGKYFVFAFSAGYTDGEEALAVLRVENGELVDKYHPADHVGITEISDLQTEDAIEYLKRRKVKEVFSFHERASKNKFLGRCLDCVGSDDWFRYEGIFDGLTGYWFDRFKRRGIKLKLLTDY